jgi:hypothetical protein
MPWTQAPALAQFHPERELDVRDAIRSSDKDKSFVEKRTEFTSAVPIAASFGPFRLLPTQFLLLEGDEPVSTFFASDERGGLRIVPVRAVVAVAAALDSILTAYRAGAGLRVARRERSKR